MAKKRKKTDEEYEELFEDLMSYASIDVDDLINEDVLRPKLKEYDYQKKFTEAFLDKIEGTDAHAEAVAEANRKYIERTKKEIYKTETIPDIEEVTIEPTYFLETVSKLKRIKGMKRRVLERREFWRGELGEIHTLDELMVYGIGPRATQRALQRYFLVDEPTATRKAREVGLRVI